MRAWVCVPTARTIGGNREGVFDPIPRMFTEPTEPFSILSAARACAYGEIIGVTLPFLP